MNKEYFIFHPHNTPEEDKKVKYHIVNYDRVSWFS